MDQEENAWRKSGRCGNGASCVEVAADWRKSSRSGPYSDNCVEVWHKSSRSQSNGACVEVAEQPGVVLVRDSKDKDGPRLSFSEDGWRAFVAGVRAGEFG